MNKESSMNKGDVMNKGVSMNKVFRVLLATMSLALVGLSAQAHPEHAGHLSFLDGAIYAHLTWTQGPDEAGGESKMKIEWHSGSSNRLIDHGLPFAAELWMPSMGHGSAPTRIAQALDQHGQPIVGTFIISNILFIMPGDWELRVKLHHKDGRIETRSLAIQIHGDHHHRH